jgi:AraC family transcriptional regulator, regulatory protein of adaptative response / methylated-DNA-[protein]-cysteine methyltransferase
VPATRPILPPRFAVTSCSLGAVLVAADEAGIRAILLGESPAPLVRDLRDYWPAASLGRGPALERLALRVVETIEAPGAPGDLPLAPAGTAFQRLVWDALRAIPVGTTATYADVARRIGAPRAARAVARACAANSLAVAIPCHRVIRSDGRAGGYRWGLERKRALLAREAMA